MLSWLLYFEATLQKGVVTVKKLLFVIWLFTGLIILVTSQGFAEDTKMEMEGLKTRVEELEKRGERQEEGSKGILGVIAEKISFSGGVELDFSYADDSDT
ncbi:MAG: hypothetical protein COW04_08570, partial [Deltaproteobacteria bacterium CG12_big_fil_rev_8_21_14_0_65_43_10]